MNEGHAYIMPPPSMISPMLASSRALTRGRSCTPSCSSVRGSTSHPHTWSGDRSIHRELIASLISPLVCRDIPTTVMVHTSLVGATTLRQLPRNYSIQLKPNHVSKLEIPQTPTPPTEPDDVPPPPLEQDLSPQGLCLRAGLQSLTSKTSCFASARS